MTAAVNKKGSLSMTDKSDNPDIFPLLNTTISFPKSFFFKN